MASLSITSFFSLLSLLSNFSPCLSESITISLSPLTKKPHTNPIQTLNLLTSTSLARAHNLKNPHKNNTFLTRSTPLSPQSYGVYSMPLSFGTPPQTLDFIMDTGSSLVWFPCTQHYVCTNCDFPKTNPNNISTFIPKSSSSSRFLSCRNPKCGRVFRQDIRSQCPDCGDFGHCAQVCPAYLIQYGTGITSGLLLSETLHFSYETVKNFIVGCSILSTSQPSGIAGLGRGPASLPSQLGLTRFHYCLVSHPFDDKVISSELVLHRGLDSGSTDSNRVSYTPFFKNPLTRNSAFQDYYYVGLQKISIGGEHIRVPYNFRAPGNDGNGGTIVDSSTSFTYMDVILFELVAKLFEKKMANHRRYIDVENQIGLRPCFAFSQETNMTFPEFVFHFNGGSKMALPLADYFSFIGDSGAVCMTIITAAGNGTNSGPSIIIGNYQQQNFYMEFDLKNERLGFRKQVCKGTK